MGAMMKRVLGLAFVGFIIWAVYYAPERVVDNPAPSASVPAAAASIPKKPDSVGNAYNVCTLVDGTGLASKPCEVSGWNSAVIATVDMSSAEARMACSQIVNMLREKGVEFGTRWTLQFRSPYSGENSIAFCHLSD
jgi:hypothetical protein